MGQDQPPKPARIFIGSSTEGLPVAKHLQAGLQPPHEVTCWDQNAFQLSQSNYANLHVLAHTYDFAAFVLTPDDLLQKRGMTGAAPGDNVLFELGLFAGVLGPERVFMVFNVDTPLLLPTDFAGIVAATYKSRSDGNLRAALGPACTRIGAQIASHAGRRVSEEPDRLGRFDANPEERPTLMGWVEVLDHIGHARRRLDILQKWIPWIRIEKQRWEEALANRDVQMRVLLIDQKLAHYRTAYRENADAFVAPTVSEIISVMAEHNRHRAQRVQARFYSCLPFGPIYLVDDTAYWGLYYAHCDSLRGPAFSAPTSSRLGKYVEASFERTWQRGHSLSGSLKFPSPVPAASPTGEPAALLVEGLGASLRADIEPVPGDELPIRAAGAGMLVVMRHADTQLNDSGIFSGDLDVGINAAGIARARLLNARLNGIAWDKVYCSTLQRSRDTLIYALGASASTFVVDRDELRERRMGNVEGLSKQSYSTDRPEYQTVDLLRDPFAKAAGGESYMDVCVRLFPFLSRVVNEVRIGQRILLCSHEAPIRMIRFALEARTLPQAMELAIPNAVPYCYVSKEAHA